MSWPRLLQEAKACKLCELFNINEGLVLLKLANTVLILINTSPSNVNGMYMVVRLSYVSSKKGQNTKNVRVQEICSFVISNL